MRFIGIDLAWKIRETPLPDTGGVVLDDGGRVIAQAHLTTDTDIVAFVLEHTETDGCIVAIDAPLVVPSGVKSRRCESDLHALGISVYSTSRTLFDRDYGGVRGEDLVARLSVHGFELTTEVRPRQAVRAIIEIYPYALIHRIWNRVTPYKNKDRSTVSRGLLELQARILTTLNPPLEWPNPPVNPNTVAQKHGEDLKRLGDILDAALASYLGYLAWHSGPERVETLGNIVEGFIMLPRSSVVTKAKPLSVRIGNRKIAEAMQALAVGQNRSVEDIVDEALRDWLERQEEVEELAAIAEVEDESTIPWEQVRAEMQASRTEKNRHDAR